jgi:RNase adaptor protein for sRNA GlmZ degradation
MSSATNAFEDLGYFCVDNLPLTMLSTFARLMQPNDEDQTAIERRHS